MTRLYAWLASIIGVIGAIVTFGALKKREGKKEAQNEANQTYIDTRKKMDSVDHISDADTAREYVRKRKHR